MLIRPAVLYFAEYCKSRSKCAPTSSIISLLKLKKVLEWATKFLYYLFVRLDSRSNCCVFWNIFGSILLTLMSFNECSKLSFSSIELMKNLTIICSCHNCFCLSWNPPSNFFHCAFLCLYLFMIVIFFWAFLCYSMLPPSSLFFFFQLPPATE